ncbi:MAG: YdcH family protein [Rhodospirillales bacterium]|nr:YdcH family protein [Rhodospirillales bacterium]MCW8861703.1 YdcH family protein [Rhodospirillales bacterium]MCW8951487.1 YdcH family protein [Rhodospirillales bacterium]MCW8970458.1 YdcH family protein [Rhodospirillales bacterium]MCW9002973.1 YdcH family protein [Rhodospirillales bacterium]
MNETDEQMVELDRLREEHRSLDATIEQITQSPPYDDLEVQRLKRRKLNLKDRISALESSMVPDIIA